MLNHTLLNNQWVKEEIKREMKQYLEILKKILKTQHAKMYGMLQMPS